MEKDANLNKNNENFKDFDELIKDLNSLLDKIPEMLETKKEKQSETKNLSDISSNMDSLQKNGEKVQDNLQKLDEEKNIKKKEDAHELDLSDVIIIPEDDDKSVEYETDKQKSDEFEILEKEETKIMEDDTRRLNEFNNIDEDLANNFKEINLKEEALGKNYEEISSQTEHLEIENTQNTISEKNQNENNKYISLMLSEEAKKLVYSVKPDSIPQERVKKIAIIYASNDDSILINFLKTVDDISFLSKNKPMFIERSVFIIYDENFSLESFVLNCQNEKINAVVLIGELSVDKIYEIENSISQIGCIFLNIKVNNFSKSVVIDFIMELIASSI